MRFTITLFLIVSVIFFLATKSYTHFRNYTLQKSTHSASIRRSGLPIPRFTSLKNQPANVRQGPGMMYAIKWIFNRKGLPLEIIAEFKNWRQIRDSEGMEGWIFHSLLSDRRTALVAPWKKEGLIALYKKKLDNGKILARVEPSVQVSINSCDGIWCHLKIGRLSGWMKQEILWGVYPDEKI
ncbi:MAG: SH3 domain-containing protein [Alphaproteobacteria bacterium]|nr:SH3 domain-containing protein [Alphaproteobacteria bacterium]